MLNKKGFTLVELLIVISVIGILAGVVIGVIDPRKQQAVATDAVTQSTMEKVAEGVEAYWAINGAYPANIRDEAMTILYNENIPETLNYTVDIANNVFYLCHVTKKDATLYFVYDSSQGAIFECGVGADVANCAVYGCE